MHKWLRPIERMGACKEALEWAEQYGSLEDAWQACERGDWMLWLLGKLSGPPESDSRKKLVLAACGCVRLALPYVEEGEEWPLKAIQTIEAYARGEGGIGLDDVRKVAAAYDVTAAATHTAYDVAYAAYDVAKADTLNKYADIVQQHYPHAPMEF